MNKLKFFIASFLGLSLILTLLILFNPTVRSIAANVELGIVSQSYIKVQQEESNERSKTPPSSEQIEQMKLDKKLCFHNNDCVGNADKLASCNDRSENKYYICPNKTIGCPTTFIGCPFDMYLVCENRECVKKRVNTIFKEIGI